MLWEWDFQLGKLEKPLHSKLHNPRWQQCKKTAVKLLNFYLYYYCGVFVTC